MQRDQEQTTREAQLRRALGLALSMLFPHEPPDSRAVSDECVALAAVECGLDDAACWQVIDAAVAKGANNAG